MTLASVSLQVVGCFVGWGQAIERVKVVGLSVCGEISPTIQRLPTLKLKSEEDQHSQFVVSVGLACLLVCMRIRPSFALALKRLCWPLS